MIIIGVINKSKLLMEIIDGNYRWELLMGIINGNNRWELLMGINYGYD